LVGLLVRVKRYQEAMQISSEHLSGVAPSQLGCPTAFQLCQLAGDSERLKELARERGDLLSFNGSAQESVEARILGCFPEDDKFGLGGRHPLRFEQEVTEILIAPSAP
jgi:hypothetical protein